MGFCLKLNLWDLRGFAFLPFSGSGKIFLVSATLPRAAPGATDPKPCQQLLVGSTDRRHREAEGRLTVFGGYDSYASQPALFSVCDQTEISWKV